jgi:hypothetical protein
MQTQNISTSLPNAFAALLHCTAGLFDHWQLDLPTQHQHSTTAAIRNLSTSLLNAFAALLHYTAGLLDHWQLDLPAQHQLSTCRHITHWNCRLPSMARH